MPRLNVNITEDTSAALKRLAAAHNTSVTDIVRRAVAVYDYVDQETRVDGKTLQLADDGDRVTNIAFV